MLPARIENLYRIGAAAKRVDYIKLAAARVKGVERALFYKKRSCRIAKQNGPVGSTLIENTLLIFLTFAKIVAV